MDSGPLPRCSDDDYILELNKKRDLVITTDYGSSKGVNMDERRLEYLIKRKEIRNIKKELEDMNQVDVAELLEPLDIHTSLLIFRMLPKDWL